MRFNTLALAGVALIPFVFAPTARPIPSKVRDRPAAVLLRYQLSPGESLRYSLSADIHGSVPILDSPTPTDLNAVVKIVYVATPKTRLADGTMDIDFKVESAELEIEKIPFPIPEEQAQQILNQTVSMLETGEVKKVQAGAPLPFGVSIPGVDPKRLYALLFPIVFQSKAVKPGEKWSFKSELLGGQGAVPEFTATLVPEEGGSVGKQPKPASKARDRRQAAAVVEGIAKIREDFTMGVDQKLDKDKKPTQDSSAIHYTRLGKIAGTGTFDFDRAKGRFASGTVTIHADVNEDRIGAPSREDEPKRMTSKIDAQVRVKLEPAAAKADPKETMYTKPAVSAPKKGNP